MLAILFGLGALSSAGQATGGGVSVKAPKAENIELGLTYTYKVAKISKMSGSAFGLKGASIDGVYWLGPRAKNIGVAFDISGEAASDIKPGVNLSQFTMAVGPRYTLWKDKSKSRGANLFSEVLIGYVHAFNSVFPAPTAAVASANSFSLQAGGGYNYPITKSIDLRVIDANYFLTKLPNASNDFQGDLRLSAGVVYRLGVPKQTP